MAMADEEKGLEEALLDGDCCGGSCSDDGCDVECCDVEVNDDEKTSLLEASRRKKEKRRGLGCSVVYRLPPGRQLIIIYVIDFT